MSCSPTLTNGRLPSFGTAARAAERASEKVQPELRHLIDTARTTGTDTGKAVALTFTELGQRFSAAWLDVALAGVDVDGLQRARRVGARAGETDGIPREPPLPDVLSQHPVLVERERDAAVLLGRVRRRHAPRVDHLEVALLHDPRPRPEVLPEPVERPVVAVAQRAQGVAEVRQVAVLEEGVA